MESQENKVNSTDQAISRCETVISSHQSEASIILRYSVTLAALFILTILFPRILYILDYNEKLANNINSDSTVLTNKILINKINNEKNISMKQYDSLITRAIILQKLLNETDKTVLQKNTLTSNNNNEFSEYILYGIFILVFGVLTSIYRLHLKEITKQEHFLVGFHRIRIAGQNSRDGFDGEVLIALTKDAFSSESVNITKNTKIVSPIPGHPTSDMATTLLNKLFDKIEVTVPTKKTN